MSRVFIMNKIKRKKARKVFLAFTIVAAGLLIFCKRFQLNFELSYEKSCSKEISRKQELNVVKKNNQITPKNFFKSLLSRGNFNKRLRDNDHDAAKVDGKLKVIVNSSKFKLTCIELEQLLADARSTNNLEFRKEHKGNKGIYFSRLNFNGEVVNVVIKIASLQDEVLHRELQNYKYQNAIKEIKALQKLNAMNWNGVPRLFGACIRKTQVIYAVQRVHGSPICSGSGTDIECLIVEDLKKFLENTFDPRFSTLQFFSKVTCFFYQFERDNVFMEDLSGSNLYYDEKTFDVYVVDADSFIFYGNTSLISRTSCKFYKDCPRPQGNLWLPESLNNKIYSSCFEVNGYCMDNICRGFDASLHTCGLGRWLVSPLRFTLPKRSEPVHRELLKCMTALEPDERCSMKEACNGFTKELQKYEQLKAG